MCYIYNLKIFGLAQPKTPGLLLAAPLSFHFTKSSKTSVVGGDDELDSDQAMPNHARSSATRTGGVWPTFAAETPTSFVPSP